MTPYLLIYLGIGAAIMAFVILRSPYDNEPAVMVKMMAGKDFSDTSNLFENILIKLLVPLSACLIIVVAWPLLLIGKVKDSWEFRYLRRQERTAKPSMAANADVELIQSPVKAKESTDLEWAANMVRQLLATTQSASKVSDV